MEIIKSLKVYYQARNMLIMSSTMFTYDLRFRPVSAKTKQSQSYSLFNPSSYYNHCYVSDPHQLFLSFSLPSSSS